LPLGDAHLRSSLRRAWYTKPELSQLQVPRRTVCNGFNCSHYGRRLSFSTKLHSCYPWERAMHLLRFVLAYADRAGGKATKRERAEGETERRGGRKRETKRRGRGTTPQWGFRMLQNRLWRYGRLLQEMIIARYSRPTYRAVRPGLSIPPFIVSPLPSPLLTIAGATPFRESHRLLKGSPSIRVSLRICRSTIRKYRPFYLVSRCFHVWLLVLFLSSRLNPV